MLVRENAIKNYQFVTIQVNQQNAVNRLYFPDLPNLRDVYTTNIEIYNLGAFFKDVNNVQPVSIAGFQKSYLTINVDGNEVIQNLDLRYLSTISTPLISFNPSGVLPLKPMKIDYQKSYVNVASGQNLGISVPFSFCFGVYYYYPNELR